MPGPEVYAECPFMGRLAGRGLDPSAAARGLAALRISRNRLRREASGTPPSTGCPKSICAKQKATTCFSDGRFYFACYRLSIIFATISVAVLTYSVMLNCLTTSTS